MELFISSIYQYIYLAFVAIVTFVSIGKYKRYPLEANVNQESSTGAEQLLVAVMTLFIGLRPMNGFFVDMSAYKARLQQLQGSTFFFTWDTDNKIYDNFEAWWGCNGFDLHLFFFIIALIYFGCAYIGIKRLFGRYALIAFIVFLGGFSTYSYSTNGIKAGAAASLFIMALGYMDKKMLCAVLMLVSLGFHHSMIMPIAAFVLTIFFKNPKWYYYGWFACFMLAVFHVSYFQNLFGGMADEQGQLYLTATEETTDAHMGFRPDFVLYSAMPVWIGYQLEMKKKMVLSSTYRTLIHFYLTANSIWMLCMYASFTNRIAYLSWCVYPIVVIYPFLDKYNRDPKRFAKFRKAALYHLYFTLFMYVVYYGILTLGR